MQDPWDPGMGRVRGLLPGGNSVARCLHGHCLTETSPHLVAPLLSERNPWICTLVGWEELSGAPGPVRTLRLPEVRGRTRMQSGLGKAAMLCLPSENKWEFNWREC